MAKKDELIQVLTYSYKYSALKDHVKTFLQEKGTDDSDEAIIDAIAERGMLLYHHSTPGQREMLKFDENPEKLIEMMSKNANTSFPLKSSQNSSTGSSGGCYVATCVYGSYDCPQVWTLRRFRDNTLGQTWYGRAFVRTYYAISPTLVKWFGHTNWFKFMWKGTLDRMVSKLGANGVEDTPYEDKEW